MTRDIVIPMAALAITMVVLAVAYVWQIVFRMRRTDKPRKQGEK